MINYLICDYKPKLTFILLLIRLTFILILYFSLLLEFILLKHMKDIHMKTKLCVLHLQLWSSDLPHNNYPDFTWVKTHSNLTLIQQLLEDWWSLITGASKSFFSVFDKYSLSHTHTNALNQSLAISTTNSDWFLIVYVEGRCLLPVDSGASKSISITIWLSW